jgi:uncharacterized membrane protein
MDKNRDKSGVDMPFTKSNYITILAGMVCILLGFVLMSGGGEHTATSFDDTIFSFRRITLAPIVVVAGFVVVGVGIMKRFKSKE